tara:strand:+ start:6643 stop:7965 length:1323 start_codon:yes stop_codon:yes gene_type:complete
MNSSQLELLKNSKKFLASFNNNKFLPYGDSLFYLATYSNFIGSSILNSISNCKNKNFFSRSITIFKDILFILNYINYKIIIPKKIISYNKIIVTWAFENNFNKDGSFKDRYFNINSKDLKETLWFVIYLSKNNPKKIADNIVFFKPITKKSLNIFVIFKIIFKNLPYLFKNFKYFLTTISNFNFFADILIKEIDPFVNYEVKNVVMPFEGQPFQNRLIYFLKENYPIIKTIGYIHSPPLAVPSNFIHKSNSPSQVILNGKDQLYCFTKILGWKKSSIKVLPSYRFLKINKKFDNTVFLPLTIRNADWVLTAIKYLCNEGYMNLKNYKIKNHPAAFNSKNNINFIKSIKKLSQKLKNKNLKNKKNYSIFIGNSGGIVEALESGAKVLQICEHPVFDIYSKNVWPSIYSKKIYDKIYLYQLKQRGNLIKFGNKNNNLKRILK